MTTHLLWECLHEACFQWNGHSSNYRYNLQFIKSRYKKVQLVLTHITTLRKHTFYRWRLTTDSMKIPFKRNRSFKTLFKDSVRAEDEWHGSRSVSLSVDLTFTAPTLLSQKVLLFANPPLITPPPGHVFSIHLHSHQPVLSTTHCFSKYG